MSQSHAQSVIRHLVSANVLLKEQLDKQTDEKKNMHKKLLQIEREQNEKKKALADKQAECAELQAKLKKMEAEIERRSTNELLGAAIAFKTSNVVVASPSKALTSTPKSNFVF
jgi:predicted nuclease with TOPRIM domain